MIRTVEKISFDRRDVIALILGLGLSLSIATTLRYPGLTFGLSEVLMIISCVFLLPLWRVTNGAIFVLSVMAVLLASSLIGGMIGPGIDDGVMRLQNLMAFLYVTFLALLLAGFRHLNWMAIFKGVTIGFIVQIAVGTWQMMKYSEYSLSVLGSFMTEHRWFFLSNNPNQIGMLASVMPMMLHILFDRKEISFLAYISSMLIVLFAVWRIGSDAVYVSLFIAGSISLGMILLNKIRFRISISRPHAIFFIIITAISLAFLSPKLISAHRGFSDSNVEEVLENIMKGRKKDDPTVQQSPKFKKEREISNATQLGVRLEIVKNGLRAWSVSPWFGMGFGAHAGLTGPFQGKEAHNTIVDVGTQAGIIGLIAVLVFWFYALKRVIKSGKTLHFSVLVALIVFSQFHYVLRHPIFWLLPIVITFTSTNQQNTT